jgi:Na+-translocating ferredoxin:NAD+ oxidoreductase RnfA subunit
MEFQLLKAASASFLVKMVPKFAVAFLEDSTTFSETCLSMPLHAIVALFGTELSKDLVTAASLMLSICKQDKIVQRIVMHQAACADFSMVLMPLVIVTAASSSTQLPKIFQLNPEIALVTSNLCRLTQVLQLSH